jgi:hypothetical protein
MALDPPIVPVVVDILDRPPPQMAVEAATSGLSTVDRTPLRPPQMAPLPEVIDAGTGVSVRP